MEKLIKKESGVNRVVGVEPDKEQVYLEVFRKLFKSEQNGIEKEHSSELDDLIIGVNGYLKEFLKKYGVDSLPIPTQSIHILDRSKMSEEQLKYLEEKYPDHNGVYRPNEQYIVMFLDYDTGSKMRFTQTLVHEILHMNGFVSYQGIQAEGSSRKDLKWDVTSEETGEQSQVSFRLRRVGFRVVSVKDKITYFYDTDEALINELTMRFDWQYFSKLPQLQEEYVKRQKVRESIITKHDITVEQAQHDIANIETKMENDEYLSIIRGYTYDEERKSLNNLIDDLYEKNKSDFSVREEVFNIFAKAVMTGRLLPVARLIEKTYGKDSFRKIGANSGKRETSEEVKSN